MNISVDPNEINSTEAILHYLRQSPKDSLKKSAADLIELLQAKVSAPLVAVTYNAIMQLIDAQYLNGSIRLTWENNSGERVLTDVCKRFTDGIIAAATQVSPQATVEPLTPAMMQAGLKALLQTTASELEGYSWKLMEGYEDDVRRVYEAISPLLAATPTANKATDAHEQLFQDYKELLADHKALEKRLATSKADTGETLQALKALYNAIDSCIDLTPEVMRQAHAAIRNAESATPSTIKPTGEQPC